ncbi:hypothetical protein GF339_07275 [candidate division KSB3 bacterium]|uniref:Small multi-drug export protein n=1 Tax=candidate division KSB3 bacterium TaxID=2044937 RepID=A0A9D5JUI6_9BACT|nr:hypothetical protein [candidate division KSB3 bacterium]MBD3324370.1 hypothetical protein [candidate division KSB3 bacterium]
MKKVNQEQPQEPSQNTRSRRFRILSSVELHILLAGALLWLAYIVWGVTVYVLELWTARELHAIIAMSVLHILFGRAAAMSFGYTVGFENSTIIFANMVVESIQVLIFYPLFVFSWRKLLVIKRLKKTMDRIHNAAETHHEFIHRYGLIGLFVFVWIPFWMTGSVIGCVIGFLLQLHPWLTISVVLAGSYVAIMSWAFLLKEIHTRMAAVSSYGSLIILGIIIAAIIIHHLLQRRKRNADPSSKP